MKTLRKTQSLAVRVSAGVEPAAVIEAIALDDERVSVPASDRVTEPCGRRIRGQFPAVSVDLAISGITLVEHHGEAGILDDLVGGWSYLDQWHAFGEAVRDRRDVAKGGHPLVKRSGFL